MASQRIPRRTFLRGAGAAIGLPWLEAMTPARAAAASAKPPVRMAFLYFPNGVWQKDWIPKETGYDYSAPPSLEPLERVRDETLVLSGLDKAHSKGGDGHYAKTANLLTGLPVAKTTGKDINAGGVSIDQLAALRRGGLTPLPSLELGIDPVISGVDSNVGYTRLYGSYISWRAPNVPVAREINPRYVYERLFGRGAAADGAGTGSLLDFVLEDARGLRGKLGRDDQFKLDEYVDSLRAVERRMEFSSKPDPREWKPERWPELPGAPEGIPHDFREHVQLMFDLLLLAFQTDSTRVATFMFANDVSGRSFSFISGVGDGHHHVSHHENDPKKYEQYSKISRWHVERFADLLEKMRAVPEGEGTLLDNSMIMLASSISDGNHHNPNNLPVLLGGRGGGALSPGRHLAAAPGTPLCNLYMTMLDAFGVKEPAFGDATGPLELA